MSEAQARALGAGDNLILADRSVAVGSVAVAYSGTDVTITSDGRSLTFGEGFSSHVHSLRAAGLGDVVVGSTGNDVINGRTSEHGQVPDDILFGGPGDDTLSGLGGADTLVGGEGVDTFAFGPSYGDEQFDVITDFQRGEHIVFYGAANSPIDGGHYVETTAADDVAAAMFAYAGPDSAIKSGRANLVVVQVGHDLLIFEDSQDRNREAGTIRVHGATLDDVDASTFAFLSSPLDRTPSAGPPPFDVAPAVAPPAAAVFQTAPPALSAVPGSAAPAPVLQLSQPTLDAAMTVQGNMDKLHFADLGGLVFGQSDSSHALLGGPDTGLQYEGSGLLYATSGELTGGSIKGIEFATDGGDLAFAISLRADVGVSVVTQWVATDASDQAFATLLGGDDLITGSAGPDLIRGLAGADLIDGGGGGDTVFGGVGNDVIYANRAAAASSGGTYLRGDDGDDWISGSSGFDDINGNRGNDTEGGGPGDDWVVGGQDNDLLFGDAGNDLVYGNLGDDTCQGGDGNDIVRGGQGNDLVMGGAGDDFLSGDKGSDTMIGGAGADIFHTFGDAGSDRVMDFNATEGDRVMLDPGTQYTVAQVGADTVISMTGGAQMTLVGIQLSALPAGWIFGA